MTEKKIIGVYLAAGNSTRFGSNKLKRMIDGQPLGSHALYQAIQSRLDKIIVVTKPSDSLSWLSSILNSYREKVIPITCMQSDKGQAYSIRCGVNAAVQHHADAIVIMLGDQPFITTSMLNKIIMIHGEQTKNQEINSFIASSFNGVPQPPILFYKQVFPNLMRLTGDYGARFIIANNELEGTFVPFKNSRYFKDIDTLEDVKENFP